jgi:S-adenosylmethionine decarboxylase proenzyme
VDKNALYLGRHLLAEYYDCNANVLNNPSLIENLMKQAAEVCGATIVQNCFHRFSPYGVSGVVVIAESHLTIHTWPEHGYASVDLYTCGDTCKPDVAFEYLREHLGSGNAFYTELQRAPFDATSNTILRQPAVLKQTRHIGSSSAFEAASAASAEMVGG